MATKSDCINIFNNMIRGTPVSFNEKLIPLISDYLTEIKFKYSDKIINLIVQNPQLAQQTLHTIEEYFCRKYNIFKLQIKLDNIFNNNFKTILYYE